MSTTNIQPFNIVSTTTITGFGIDGIDLQVFVSAKIRVNLFNSSGTRVDIRYVMLEGDDYANWGNNDQYIITFVSNALGMIVVEPVVVIVETVVDPVVIVDPIVDPVIDIFVEPVFDLAAEIIVDPAVIDPAVIDPVIVDPVIVDPVIVDPVV